MRPIIKHTSISYVYVRYTIVIIHSVTIPQLFRPIAFANFYALEDKKTNELERTNTTMVWS